jgi:RNA polymerase sigma-70 factor (ECF subfamily)
VDERHLLLRLQSGDELALAEIIERHSPMVLGYARRITGSPAMAEDILQEVLTILWREPSSHRAPT